MLFLATESAVQRFSNHMMNKENHVSEWNADHHCQSSVLGAGIEKDINTMHVWCVGVCLCVSEKACTEVLSWEHPVSDPCLSSCVERTLQCVFAERDSEVEEQHKEQRSIVRHRASSGPLTVHMLRLT